MGYEDAAIERSMERLQQLAREEREAVDSSNTEALCRIAEIYLPAVNAVRYQFMANPAASSAKYEIQLKGIELAHNKAITYLQSRLSAVSAELKQNSSSRRTAKAYGNRLTAKPIRLDQKK